MSYRGEGGGAVLDSVVKCLKLIVRREIVYSAAGAVRRQYFFLVQQALVEIVCFFSMSVDVRFLLQ